MKKFLITFVTAALLTVGLCVPAFAVGVDASNFVPNFDIPVLECNYLLPFVTSPDPDPSFVIGFYDDTDHYLCCSVCGAVLSSSMIYESPCPHTGKDCAFCSEASSSLGLEILGRLPSPDSDFSSAVLSAITQFVTVSAGWLSAFALCIVINPLLFGFVIIVFVGLGIGLIKRVIRL